MTRNLCLIALLLCTLHRTALASSLRGVNPRYASHYKIEPFKCLDQSQPALSKVVVLNDDYCDCPDGSDEPGTSACSNGKFYCRNVGYQSTWLSSTFVNDGICDCCDGADEWEGHTSCQNTCVALGGNRMADLENQLQTAKIGNQIRRRSIADAVNAKGKLEAELKELNVQHAQVKPVVENLRAVMTKLEKEEDEKDAASNAEQSHGDQDDYTVPDSEDDMDPAARRAWCEESEEQMNHCREEGWLHDDYEPGMGHDYGDYDHHTYDEQYAEGDDAAYEGETEAERGARIARQWTNNAEATGNEESPPEETDAEVGARIASQWTNNKESGLPEESEAAPAENNGYVKPADWDEVEDGEWVAPEVAGTLEEVRKQHTANNAKLRNIENEQSKLQRLVTQDFGPGNEFLDLKDACINLRVSQYNYKVCMFDRASQDSTQLGTWEGFKDDYTKAVFGKGTMCPGGPHRSLTLSLVCGGAEPALLEVSEPSRCEYAGTIAVAAACTDEHLKELEEELKILKEGETHDEFR